jgi:hypothetical protein
MKPERLPWAMETLVLGLLSIPLAFARQLCVPALLMAVLAMGLHLLGRRKQRKRSCSPRDVKRSLLGFRLALAGAALSLAMWLLWSTGVLL